MENVIVVFKNRNNAMQFATNLKKRGISSRVISTPRELSLSCGISVVVNSKFLNIVKAIISQYGYQNSVKLYLFKVSDIFKNYTPIY